MIYHIRGYTFVSLLYHWGWSLIATYIRKLKDRSGNYVSPAVRAKGVYLDSNKTLSEVFYPVGAIFQSTSSTSPASMYGGSWEKIEGRFLLGTSSRYSVSSTGGEAEHTLITEEMPKHRHRPASSMNGYLNLADNGNLYITYDSSQLSGTMRVFGNGYTGYNGGNSDESDGSDGEGYGDPHNNMPPYYSVYIWRRVA